MTFWKEEIKEGTRNEESWKFYNLSGYVYNYSFLNNQNTYSAYDKYGICLIAATVIITYFH